MALSIVIPAHNAAGTLAETLDSLLVQTRGDWQAIIVDDGSTDATSRVVEAYAARDQRFTLLAKEGDAEGVSAARNRGIAAARGQWLHFLDADDTIEPAFVERMVGKLEDNAAAKVACCGARRVTAAGRLGPPWIPTAVAREPFEAFARAFPIVIHGAVLDRALVVEQGGFDPRLRTAEDMDFFQRIARTGVAFLLVPDALALYRMRDGSLATDARVMLADTDLVITRAFRRDPRVLRPAARYADGADPVQGSEEMARGINALWCAAVDIGQGGDGAGFVRPLPDRRRDLAGLCRQTILEGLEFGARKLADELAGNARLATALRGLFDELETVTQHKGLARMLEFMFEPTIFRPVSLSERLVTDRTLFVRQDIARLRPIAITSEIDRLHVEFSSGRHLVGATTAPALGHFSLRDVMQLALDAVSLTEVVRSGGLAARPRFWLQAALAAARLGVAATAATLQGRAMPVHGPRALAKSVLGDAALATTGGTGSCEHAIASLIAEGRAMVTHTTPAPAASPARRVEARARETTDRFPILLYHRITESGPIGLARYRQTPAAFAEQMRWLRQQGYDAVTSNDVLLHATGHRPFQGRPVLISFDDGYLDFHDVAWPILRAHDFTAEVFVVTDCVGGHADWDVAYGPPAALMDWRHVQSLAAAGIRFGSHMASHSHMADLSMRAIVLEAARSRATLESALGTPCRSIAAPFGEGDECFTRIARQCGYEAGFTTDPGHAALGQDTLQLPRLEVIGGWSLDEFASAVRSR